MSARYDGYGLYLGPHYCCSLSTGRQDDGTREFFLHTFRGTKQHVYCRVDEEAGLYLEGGTKLTDRPADKDSRRSFGGYGGGQPFARVAMRKSDGGYEVEIADITGGSSAVSATPVESRLASSRNLQDVQLPASTGVNQAVFYFSLIDAAARPPETQIDLEHEREIRFSGDSRRGVLIRRVDSS